MTSNTHSPGKVTRTSKRSVVRCLSPTKVLSDSGKPKRPRPRCKVCGNTFSKPANLKAHERIHTGETRYACKICNRRFVWKSSLNFHDNSAHKELKRGIELAKSPASETSSVAVSPFSASSVDAPQIQLDPPHYTGHADRQLLEQLNLTSTNTPSALGPTGFEQSREPEAADNSATLLTSPIDVMMTSARAFEIPTDACSTMGMLEAAYMSRPERGILPSGMLESLSQYEPACPVAVRFKDTTQTEFSTLYDEFDCNPEGPDINGHTVIGHMAQPMPAAWEGNPDYYARGDVGSSLEATDWRPIISPDWFDKTQTATTDGQYRENDRQIDEDAQFLSLMISQRLPSGADVLFSEDGHDLHCKANVSHEDSFSFENQLGYHPSS